MTEIWCHCGPEGLKAQRSNLPGCGADLLSFPWA